MPHRPKLVRLSRRINLHDGDKMRSQIDFYKLAWSIPNDVAVRWSGMPAARMLRSAWAYRRFIVASIQSELLRRFARSGLGAMWFILHPLAQAAIFAVVLSEVIAVKLPAVSGHAGYALYLTAGMAAWGLFSEISTRCTVVFIEYGAAMKKISFPRLCLPLIVVGNALLHHCLLLIAIIVVFVPFGHVPGIAWSAIPLATLSITGFAAGLGLLLGVFNVFARDVGQVFGVVVQIWFWLTPIVYLPEVLPERLRWLAQVNPMAAPVAVYQQALLHNEFPHWQQFLLPALAALVVLAMALFIFRRASAEIVDAL